MARILFIFIAFQILSGCSHHEKQEHNKREETSLEVRKALNDYFDDVSINGISAEFNWFDDSGDFYWVPPSFRSPLSYDSIKNILDQNAKRTRSVDLEWQTLKILPLSDNVANYTGTILATTVDTSGASTTIQLIETGTIVKRKNGWKLLCGQTAIIE